MSQIVENLPAVREELGSIPGSAKSPGKANGYPCQYSCLENSMDRGAWQATVHGVTKGQTQPSDQHNTLGSAVVLDTRNLY